MDLYIKSFNRAYLLHRTLESIRQNLIGFDGRIILLDDGTPEPLLKELLKMYPNTEIRKSPDYAEKSQAILSNATPKRVIPTVFWMEEVMKGTDYFILIEDDTWLSEPVDFHVLRQEVKEMKMDMVKFMWLGNKNLISKNKTSSAKYVCQVVPELWTKNSFLFDAIFKLNRFKVQLLFKLFNNFDEELYRYYQLYIVAGGVFSKRYYTTCWKNSLNKVDELQQISQLLKSKEVYNVGNTVQEVLKTTIKTTSSLIAKEHLGSTMEVHKINQILNNAWLEGNRYSIDDFKNDIPTVWIEKQLESHSEGGRALVDEWRNWYKSFETSYEKMGCKF